ncbi:hypothetical protein [Paenimyroides ummariense]|nr:hypothetical protein [Paenimyroides ummariense]
MKNLILLLFISSITACSDDDFLKSDFEMQRNDKTVEIPPEGLKLKYKHGLIDQQFFYNTNGFVDSIYNYHSWGSSFAHKYIYNNLNQIVEVRYHEIVAQKPEFNKKDITFYNYNSVNQITSAVTYDKDNVAIEYLTYTYNKDGSLFDADKRVINGNLVQDALRKYEFDSFRNPPYNLYPKAYRIINYINKNNVIKTESTYGSDVHINIHTLKYNTENYIIEEDISNMGLDTDDHRQFTYH